MKKIVIKEPVKLRMKKLKDGRLSLYLDIYSDGVRKYDFLHLYLYPEENSAIKTRNEEVLRLATAIKSKRVIEVQSKKYGIEDNSLKNADFIRYMVKRAFSATECKTGTRSNSVHCGKLLRKYAKREEVPFKMITPDFLAGFVKFLKMCKTRYGTQYKANTVCVLFSMIVTALNDAERRGVIRENPIRKMMLEDFPKEEKTNVGYLTQEEVVAICKTETRFKYTKTIFLFGCFTGLRYSDIVSLRWENIRKDGSNMYIQLKQQKTKSMVYIPMSSSAVKLLPPSGHNDEFVFTNQKGYKTVSDQIKLIAKEVGINRNITFHMSRHTFATLLVSLDVDIYTVSKMLGHSNVNTTQRYAEVINKKKEEAIEKIPDLL